MIVAVGAGSVGNPARSNNSREDRQTFTTATDVTTLDHGMTREAIEALLRWLCESNRC